ncbi:YaaC family protein [Bacillus carboniphilus]|uniref:YaaC family protein n=1 Tax=Bacillus carboniphilus TaxID=86663 RepID=A0ABP3G8P7_9BACI
MNPSSIWSKIDIFMSSTFVQKQLKGYYEKHNIDPQKSYENTYRFMYFLEQGKVYYQQADMSPISIKPTLLFYGFIHLIKACILLVDADYPETTSVLAHGVTARKRKKQNYSFLQDEIKTQKNGLFPHMCLKMFHMKHLEGEKWAMDELLKEIPEIGDYIEQLLEDKPNTLVEQSINKVIIPDHILDNYYVSIGGFVQYLSTFFESTSIQTNSQQKQHQLIFSKPTFQGDYESLPFRYHLERNQYCLRTKRTTLQSYPELLIHYLLLYNLSMIARYETDWWCDLIKTMPNEEYPLISAFLQITTIKGPYLVWKYLEGLLD